MSEKETNKKALVQYSAQQLTVRASLITRGLQHVVQHRSPAVAWSRPHLVGTLSSPSEADNTDDPTRKFIYFSCHLKNITESNHSMNEGVAILRRSRATGEVTSIPEEGFGFPASRVFVASKEVSPEMLVGLSFAKEKSVEECLTALFQESCELLAYDEKFHTIIAIPLDQPNVLGLPASVVKTRRILEVDDEEPIRAIIRKMLISAGYECTSVPNGIDALALLDSGERFDLLLNDLLNAPMDGITLLERAQEKFPDLPVVMATAVHDIHVALAAQRFGASDYLLKPFEREQLLTIVRQVLACRNQPKRPILEWEQGLSTLIEPAFEEQSVIRTRDGRPKLIRDLSPGDKLVVQHGNEAHFLDLYEKDGKLAAIDFVPDEPGRSVPDR